MKKKVILITFITILLIFAIIYMSLNNKHKENEKIMSMIENEMNIDFPPIAKIINSSISQHSSVRSLGIRFSIDKEYLDDLLYSLNSKMVLCNSPENQKDNFYPNYKNRVIWWDLEKTDILYEYSQVYNEKGNIYWIAYITKEINGKYNVYIII